MFPVRPALNFFVVVIFLLLFSCERKWTDKDRSEFISGCMHGGAVSDMGEERAKSYCKCMLEKIVVKYPNRQDANYIRYDTTLAMLAAECSKHP